MEPRSPNETWAAWTRRTSPPERAKRSVQNSISKAQILAVIETPDSFIAWLQRQHPNTEVAALYDPTHDMLGEYLWAELGVFAGAADSIVWVAKVDGYIEWDELPVWVQSLNRIEARHAEAVPDDKRTWMASEVLAMAREAVGQDHGTY